MIGALEVTSKEPIKNLKISPQVYQAVEKVTDGSIFVYDNKDSALDYSSRMADYLGKKANYGITGAVGGGLLTTIAGRKLANSILKDKDEDSSSKRRLKKVGRNIIQLGSTLGGVIGGKLLGDYLVEGDHKKITDKYGVFAGSDGMYHVKTKNFGLVNKSIDYYNRVARGHRIQHERANKILGEYGVSLDDAESKLSKKRLNQLREELIRDNDEIWTRFDNGVDLKDYDAHTLRKVDSDRQNFSKYLSKGYNRSKKIIRDGALLGTLVGISSINKDNGTLNALKRVAIGGSLGAVTGAILSRNGGLSEEERGLIDKVRREDLSARDMNSKLTQFLTKERSL